MEATTGTLREAIAAEVRAEMARKRIRQTEVAAELGVSQKHVSRRLSAEVPMDIDDLERFAHLLGVSVATLIERAGSTKTAWTQSLSASTCANDLIVAA